MSKKDTVACVSLKKSSIASKRTPCSNGDGAWEVASEISSGTSYGIVYQACCELDCTYILKYQKFNLHDESIPIIDENMVKNEVEMQVKASVHNLAPVVYDSWVCENGGIIIMAPMKRSVSMLLEIYKREDVRKLIVDTVFYTISKLHMIGINHGDAHLDNIMVDYTRSTIPSKYEMDEYMASEYVYKFIDFGVAENINEREKYKQMIGDYSKATDSIGRMAGGDRSLESIYNYAEEKTRKIAISYGLISDGDDEEED